MSELRSPLGRQSMQRVNVSCIGTHKQALLAVQVLSQVMEEQPDCRGLVRRRQLLRATSWPSISFKGHFSGSYWSRVSSVSPCPFSSKCTPEPQPTASYRSSWSLQLQQLKISTVPLLSLCPPVCTAVEILLLSGWWDFIKQEIRIQPKTTANVSLPWPTKHSCNQSHKKGGIFKWAVRIDSLTTVSSSPLLFPIRAGKLRSEKSPSRALPTLT